MFVIDNILMSPFKGLIWICRELHKAVEQEQVNEQDSLSNELSKLYMLLETKQITEEQFEEREREILDRLDELEGNGGGADGG